MTFLRSEQRLGVAAILLAVSNLLSRLMGLIRDKVISWQFGASQESDMYFAAFVIPDIINYLLAGGFMSITMIPLLAKLFKTNAENAWRFFSAVVTLLFLTSTCLTLSCMILAEPLAKWIAPGFNADQIHRLAFFMRIILPAQICFLTGSCFTAILFLKKQFQVPALTPLLYNGFIILIGVLLPFIAQFFYPNATYQDMLNHLGMTGYCIGVTLGAFIGAFLLPFLTVKGQELHFQICFHHPYLKKFLIIALPLMLGQTIMVLDEQLLRIFGSYIGSGSVSLLNYSRRIAQVPIGLVGQAAAVASYPFLVQLLTQNNHALFMSTINKAMRAGLYVIVPCVGFMLAASWPILALIFQGGRFSSADTLTCVPLTQIMLCSVPLWMLYMILVRAFYAMEDTLTPVITGTIMTVVVLPIYYIGAHYNSTTLLALTSALSVSIYIIWLMLIWRKRFGSTIYQGLMTNFCKLTVCVLPAALIAYATINIMANYFTYYGLIFACLSLASSGTIFIIIFLPLLFWLQPDLKPLFISKLKSFVKKH